jgi:hypothetical protein
VTHRLEAKWRLGGVSGGARQVGVHGAREWRIA